jgi:replication-associated recombination protein RarA
MGADQELFDDLAVRPLADRLRPQSIDDVVGQDHISETKEDLSGG